MIRWTRDREEVRNKQAALQGKKVQRGLYFAVKILLLDRHGFMEDSSFRNPMLDDMEVTVRPL